jgi:RND family efflux transporter MFP subunit
VAFWAGVACLVGPPAAAQPGSQVALVGVAKITEQEVAAGQSFVGTVYPQRKSTVGSAEEGRVVGFFVNEGDFVRKDQELAQLRTETLKIELLQAEAEAELKRQELLELKNGTRPEEKAQAAAELARDKAQMDYAEARYRRAQTLFTQNRAVSREELDEAMSAASAARNNFLASQARYDLAEKGPREEKIAQAQARHDAQLQVVARIRDTMDKRTIRAPFDGYIAAEYTEEGQWVAKGDPIVDVVDLAAVEVHVSVPESYIAAVTTGMTVPITVEALPRETFGGEIIRIVPQANLQARTFPVIARVDNRKQGPRYALKAGMLARATLAVGQPQTALLVPKDALVLGGATPRVYVVQPDPKNRAQPVAQPVPVRIGVAAGELVQVMGDLVKGQLVVVRGNERLLPFGQPVKVIESN